MPQLPFKLGFALAVCLEGGRAHNDLNSPGYSRSPVVSVSVKIGPLINFIRRALPPFFWYLVGGAKFVSLLHRRKPHIIRSVI